MLETLFIATLILLFLNRSKRKRRARTLDVVKLTGTGIDFPTAFQQVYKISMAEYFKQLRAYLKTLDYGW